MRTPFFFIDDESDEECQKKVAHVFVIGSKKVGKSTFIHRVTRNEFSLSYVPTKNLEVYEPVKIGLRYLKMYDIPEDLIESTVAQPDAVILMCNDAESLSKLKRLYEKLNKLSETWVVIQNMGTALPEISSINICHPERVFTVNNCSTDGIGDLVYDILQTI